MIKLMRKPLLVLSFLSESRKRKKVALDSLNVRATIGQMSQGPFI